VEYTPDALRKLLEIDTVVAIKEASFDAMTFVRTASIVKTKRPEVIYLTGNDNFIMHSFILGAEGALIGFGTLATRMQVQMIAATLRHDYDEAFRLSDIVQPLANAIFAQPVPNYRARTKEALVMQEVIRSATVRPPLLPLSRDEREAVRQALERAGLLQMVLA